MNRAKSVGMLMNSQYYSQGYKQGASDVIDKIRAEIEFEIDHRTNMLCAEDVLAIIDKYREGSDKE